MKIILASQSPRRKELMDLLNIDYEIKVSNVEETLEDGLSIEEQSRKLAYIKAKSIFDKTKGDRIIIGSDTMVIKDGKIYGKPKDRQDAINMLRTIRNTNHQVITSLAVLIQEGPNYTEKTDVDIANVYLKDISDEELESWIDTGNPFDKAGAYAIQSEFCVHVDKIEGNYTTVIGLPMHKLYDFIKDYIY